MGEAQPADASTAPGPPALDIADGVASIRLRRPAQHNRLEPSDIPALARLIAIIDGEPAVRVVRLLAEGPTFCAGYDLADLGRPSADDDAASGVGALAGMIDALEACRAPTIAVLNGPVYGGGTDLALACDFRLGMPNCRMTMPAARFGLHYYHGGMRRYCERLGLGAAKRLFLLGETLDAAAMHGIGFLDEVLPDPASLQAREAALVDTLRSAADQGVIESMKRCLGRIARGDLDSAEADAAWARTRRSPAVGAAVAAERGRRKPKSDDTVRR